MNLSLSNTLGKRMAINPDGLSLDLAFAADKTLTARKGPTPTFTRASTATFVGSNGLIQSAAIDEARFDHDPVTGECRGLLIEEQRTNSFTDSNPNNWAAARVTKTPTSGLGFPNNASILEAIALGSQYIFRTTAITVGLTYTISCRVKAGTAAILGFIDFSTSAGSRGFNANTGEWPSSGGTAIYSQYASTELTNGWYLISFAYTPTGATGLRNIGFTVNDTPQVIGATILIDTPQIEVGAFPTSYIPTTTAELTRSADVCSITGGDFTSFYNQSEGTFSTSVESFAPGTVRRIVFATDGTTANRMGILFNSAPPAFLISNAGNLQANFNFSNSAATRLAGAYAQDDYAASGNGSAVVTDTSGLLPVALNRLHIGNQLSSDFLNGHIARIQYFRKRLANAKLITLTT